MRNQNPPLKAALELLFFDRSDPNSNPNPICMQVRWDPAHQGIPDTAKLFVAQPLGSIAQLPNFLQHCEWIGTNGSYTGVNIPIGAANAVLSLVDGWAKFAPAHTSLQQLTQAFAPPFDQLIYGIMSGEARICIETPDASDLNATIATIKNNIPHVTTLELTPDAAGVRMSVDDYERLNSAWRQITDKKPRSISATPNLSPESQKALAHLFANPEEKHGIAKAELHHYPQELAQHPKPIPRVMASILQKRYGQFAQDNMVQTHPDCWQGFISHLHTAYEQKSDSSTYPLFTVLELQRGMHINRLPNRLVQNCSSPHTPLTRAFDDIDRNHFDVLWPLSINEPALLKEIARIYDDLSLNPNELHPEEHEGTTYLRMPAKHFHALHEAHNALRPPPETPPPPKSGQVIQLPFGKGR